VSLIDRIIRITLFSQITNQWLEHNEQRDRENKPIGLILCSEKSKEQINYLMLPPSRKNNSTEIISYNLSIFCGQSFVCWE